MAFVELQKHVVRMDNGVPTVTSEPTDSTESGYIDFSTLTGSVRANTRNALGICFGPNNDKWKTYSIHTVVHKGCDLRAAMVAAIDAGIFGDASLVADAAPKLPVDHKLTAKAMKAKQRAELLRNT